MLGLNLLRLARLFWLNLLRLARLFWRFPAANKTLDLIGHLGVVPQEVRELLTALLPVAVETQPSAGLANDLLVHSRLQHAALPRNALAEDDVELSCPVGGRQLVLLDGDLDAYLMWTLSRTHEATLRRAHHQADGRGVLDRIAPGSDFRWPVPANVCPELVDQEQSSVCPGQEARDLPHELAHESGQQAHCHFAHVILQLRLGHQGSYAVDDDEVVHAFLGRFDGYVGALLSRRWIVEVPLVGVDTEHNSVLQVKSALSVNEGAMTALLLNARNGVQCERGLATLLWAKDLDDAPVGQAAPEREVHCEGAGRKAVVGHHRLIHLHHDPFPEFLAHAGSEFCPLCIRSVAAARIRLLARAWPSPSPARGGCNGPRHGLQAPARSMP
mmetsp:Transcript_81844/g.226803  ORF Transcript_81844/g.226803 Transcript_81844/m.226803 type:complete len:386 (+) Transcript_81844:118-1275(+)